MKRKVTGRKFKRSLSRARRALRRELTAGETASEAAALLVDGFDISDEHLPDVFDVLVRTHREMARATAADLEGA